MFGVAVADSHSGAINLCVPFLNENIETRGEMEQENYVFDCSEKKAGKLRQARGKQLKSSDVLKNPAAHSPSICDSGGQPPGVFVSACLT